MFEIGYDIYDEVRHEYGYVEDVQGNLVKVVLDSGYLGWVSEDRLISADNAAFFYGDEDEFDCDELGLEVEMGVNY